MCLRHTSVLALLGALLVGLVAAPPATSAPTQETAVAKDITAMQKASTKGTITGKVTYRGKPAKNVRVVAHGTNGSAYGTKTSSKGRFTLKVPARTYKVYAEAGKYNAHTTFAGSTLRREDAKKLKVRKGRTVTANVKLAKAAAVTGRIVDPQGKPVKDGMVEIGRYLDRPGKYVEWYTDGKGRYTITGLPAGRVEIYATDYQVSGPFGHEGSAVVRLKRGKTVTAPDIVVARVPWGTLTAEVDWACEPYCPDDHMPVSAYDEDGNRQWLQQDPKTKLWSTQVLPGTYRVTVNGSNLVTAPVKVTEGATVHAGTIVVTPAHGTLTGKVLTKDGQPVSTGTDLLILDALGGYTAHAKVGKDGAYRVDHLAPGTHSVYVQSPKASWGPEPRPTQVTVTAGATTTADIRFERGRTVKGTVKYNGKGVKGISVTLERDYPLSDIVARTGSKGRFTLKNVPTGTFTLEVTDTTPTYRIERKTVTVKGNISGLKIKLRK